MSTSPSQNLQEVQQCIDQYCNPDTLPSQRSNILQRIGSITLEQCIQLMGPYITSTEGTIRSHSYRVLYKILTEETEALKSEFGDFWESNNDDPMSGSPQRQRLAAEARLVQRKQTYNSLCRFFADRMQDFEGLVDLLPSVEHLLSHYHTVLDDANVSLLVTQTLHDINTQALKQSTRKTVYDIFDRLMTWFPQLCKVDFLTGFVQCADGERDPINLLQVMRMVPRMVNVAHEESVRMVAEEIFDTILSPYFPINFKPPANDTRRITPEQLSDALRDAMASTPHFSTYCFTFLLDKVTSPITETKVVSLETLAFCVASYGEIYTRPFLVEIWNVVRTEILRSSSSEVIRACLDAIVKIAETVATTSNITVNMANLEGLIKPALSEIRSPDPKFAGAYSSMLSAAGEASDIVATFIFNATAPHLCHLYHVQQQQQQNDQSPTPVHSRITSCIALLVLARCILEPLAKHSTQSIRPCMNNIGKISQFLNSILEDQNLRDHEDLQNELTSTMLRLAAFDGVANVGNVFQMIKDGLLDTNENSQVRANAIKGIAWLHTVGKDDMIISRIVQPLLQTLWQNDQPQLMLEAAIDALAKIGTTCGEYIASDMTEKLFAVIDTPTDSGVLRLKLLEALEKVVEKSGKTLDEYAVLRIKRIMTSTIRSGLDGAKLDEKELELLSRITGRLYSGLPEKDQIDLLAIATSAVLHGAIDWTQLSHNAENEPFQPLYSSNHGQFIVPFTALLVYSLPQSITSLSDIIIDLCRLLMQHVIMTELHTDFTILCVKHALASVANKISKLDVVMETVVQGMLMSQIDTIGQHSHMIQIRMIETLGWILKGIVMRGANKWSDVLSRFACSLLLSSDEATSTTAAEMFHLVMSDEPNVLDATVTHAKVQVLHKQRFFSVNMNVLVQALQQHRNARDPSAQQQNKEASIGPLLLSVAYLVQNVPKTVIVSELERVLPLLLSALTSSSASSKLVLSSLKTTHVLLSSAQDKMCDYLDSIVGPLLSLTAFKDSVAVRIAAVQCLHALIDYPYHKLFPHQKAIIRGLEPVLDDAKRAVRQEGAKCRNAFFLLSSE